MKNPAKISNPFLTEAVLGHSKPQGTSQVTAPSSSFRFPSGHTGSIPVSRCFLPHEVNSQELQSGLLKAITPQGVYSPERGFLFTPDVSQGVGKGDDQPCELLEESQGLNLRLWRFKIALQRFSLWSKKVSTPKRLNLAGKIFLCGIIFLACLQTSVTATSSITIGGLVTSYNFNSDNCIRALVGEVEGESYQTKLATAECLRNRKTLKGVYGINSKRIPLVSKKVWADCQKAWEESAHSNLVRGATVWGNAADVKKFKKQKWFKSYYLTAKVGGHYFFAEKKLKKKEIKK